MLSMKLNVCSNIVQDNNLINEVDTQNNIHIPDTSWSATSRTKYIQALNSPDIQKKIMSLNEINNDGHTLIDGLPEIMVSAGTLSVFKKSVKRKSKGRPRRINKRWYDIDCYKLLREVKSAKKTAFSRNVSNASLRIIYYRKFKEYKRLTQFKKWHHREKLANLLTHAK